MKKPYPLGLIIGATYLFVVILMAVFADSIAPYSFDTQDLMHGLESSSWAHWFGTDLLGRDLFSRVLFGARMSLAVGIIASTVALLLGVSLGAIAGYFGGWLDTFIMRFSDMLYSFPVLLLAILLMLLLGRGPSGIILAICLVTWIHQARLSRGVVMQLKETPFVESARALGLNDFQILRHHILPNLLGPVLVLFTFQIPGNILAESFLSFIGLGLEPPHASWGTLASDGFRAMRSYPHLMIYPSVVLFITMLAFHAVGEGMRKILNPKEDLGSYSL